jgi:hypothetical protein
MARKERKYHYIYRITCLKNNRYYIGMHSTDNLDDGYMGGGKRIKNSVKKHGKDSHRKEILEFFENRDLLRNREIELVNEELLNDPMCMNLQPGGGGGFINEEHRKKAQRLGGIATLKIMRKRFKEKEEKNPEYKIERIKKIRDTNFKKTGSYNGRKGKKHSNETKKKIGEKNSINSLGSNNSQFGTMWIFNVLLKINKKIKKNEETPIGWEKGRRIIFD